MARTANRSMRGRTIIDDRGRAWTVYWPKKRQEFKDELPGDVRRRVNTAVARGYFGNRRWRALALIALMAGLTKVGLIVSPHLVSMLGLQWATGWRSWIVPLLYGGMLGLIVWGAMALEHARARQRFAEAVLDEDHCPRCLYPLHGLPEEDDGCTVCPECGAAWRR